MKNGMRAIVVLGALVFAACGVERDEMESEPICGYAEEGAREDAETGLPEAEELLTEAEQSGAAGTIYVSLPKGWDYELCPAGDEGLLAGDYGIHFYPEGVSEGYVELSFQEFFGVCGTGLEQEEVALAGERAVVGTYDHHEYWDFVSWHGEKKGLVAMTYRVEDWWAEYGERTWDILDSVRWDKE